MMPEAPNAGSNFLRFFNMVTTLISGGFCKKKEIGFITNRQKRDLPVGAPAATVDPPLTARHLEGSSAMMRQEKRALDLSDGHDHGGPDAKRQKLPSIASVIVEAVKRDSLQKLCSLLEPRIRQIVSEQVERSLATMVPSRLGARSSPKRIEGPDGRNLQLHFNSRLSLPIFTGRRVEGEQGASINVVLIDANSGSVVTSGPESIAKLDVVVLEGDFNNVDENPTDEEFESHVVKEREGKVPLLDGDLQVSLKEGVGTLGELKFTDNSSWTRSGKFRLGLKISSGYCDGIRVREGKTEAVTVMHKRGELYKKHYPPALKDEVWRLKKISKDGAFHKKLNKAGICIVEDFLRLMVADQQKLRNILGSGMTNKMWDILLEHAKTCILSGKYYIYYSDERRNVGAILKNIFEFSGLVDGEQYYSAESLDDSQKVFADTLVKKAYDNWMHVIEYDGEALLSFKQTKKFPRNETSSSAPTNPSHDQESSKQHLPAPVAMEQPSVYSGVSTGGAVGTGYNGNQASRYSSQPQQLSSNINIEFENASFVSHHQFNGSSQQTQVTRGNNTALGLGPPLQASLVYHQDGQSIQSVNTNSYNDWSHPRESLSVDDFSEEEIRMRSHEMLENDDMQHLLRVLTMAGSTSNLQEDGYNFPSYTPSPFPNYNLDDDRNRSSGKAVVGWLKIKAAMRWGIFIRKKAAERRAQIVELEDE